MLRRIVRSLLLVIFSGAFAAALPANYARAVVFGDSLSDTGNVYRMTFGLYPPSPYWNGRFSNGPVWVETIAAHFGLRVDPSLGGGTNYAYGGAETGSGFSHAGTPNVERQIDAFRSRYGQFSQNDLVIFYIGANDFLSGQTNPQIPLANIHNELQTLYNLGARNILVGNLPLLGYTPGALGTPDQDTLNALSLAFNQGLALEFWAFKSTHPLATLTMLDVQRYFMLVRAFPLAFGFTNITDSYMDSGSGDPDRYLFWDTVHPTRVMHAYFGGYAILNLQN